MLHDEGMAPAKDDRYLAQLVTELASDPAYHTGRRRFPRTVDEDDASVIAGNLQAEVDRATAERDRAAAQKGVSIACALGCNACCAHLVMVYAPEAIRIARWLSLPRNAAARDAFLARYPTWREGAGDAPERMAELTARAEHEPRAEVHLAHFRKGVMCAFNGPEGECTIHPVRPIACRHAHAIDTAEGCRPSPRDGLPHVRSFPFLPLDEFIVRARLLERATHHATGGARLRPAAVCQAVYELLTGKKR
jgi:Fe-S-cluster containining protein